MPQLEIKQMPRTEIDVAIERAAQEGWNPGLHDAECFYSIDPNGFFMAVLDGVVVARASALVYDDAFAFCGLYIVERPYRGKGYGLALTKARLEYIGDRNAGLDGVVSMTDKYARLGYKTAHISRRYVYTPTARVQHSQHVVPVADVSFEQLLRYDGRPFPANTIND